MDNFLNISSDFAVITTIILQKPLLLQNQNLPIAKSASHFTSEIEELTLFNEKQNFNYSEFPKMPTRTRTPSGLQLQ